MEKRNVKFSKDAQSALLWLMANRGKKLFDENGNFVIHRTSGNIIEYHYSDLKNQGKYEVDVLDYEDFVKQFNSHILESI